MQARPGVTATSEASAVEAIADPVPPRAPLSPWQRRLVFVRNFLRHPVMVGSFLQSSPRLVERLVSEVDWTGARTIVEYGPGVGTITTALLERLPQDGRLVAIELNDEFVALLEQSVDDPRFAVERGVAGDVAAILARHQLSQADVILSGIPFSTMTERERGDTLAATHAALRPGGRFVVYQYSRKVLKPLRALFADVRTGVEWRNGLPMQVFVCTK